MSHTVSERIVIEVLQGGLRVVLGRQSITRFRSRKHAALLAYLACHEPGSPHGRGVVADALWPRSSPESARASLCEAISSLRAQVESLGIPRGSILLADRTTIALNPGVQTDLQMLRSFLLRADQADRRSDHELAADLRLQAVRLYPKDLLPDLSEEWLLVLHARLSAQVAEAECVIARHFLRVGDRRTAIVHVRRATQIDEICPSLSPELEALIAVPAEAAQLPASELSQPSAVRASACVRPRGRTRPVERRRSVRQASSAPPTIPLRVPASRLFGRDRERETIKARLRDSSVRFLTLTGPGGIGKTRLALAVAQDWVLAEPRDAVWFVPLASVRDADQLHSRLLRALSDDRRQRTAGTPWVQDARNALVKTLLAADRDILLILDNVEQIIEPVGELIAFLLAEAPRLKCVATSRQRLLRHGEKCFPVEGLPTPSRFYGLTASEPGEIVDSWPSVALFVDRAVQAAPNFRLTPANVKFIASLVKRLEGIPLAIELAAARSLMFTPGQMLEQMTDRRFDLLADPHSRSQSLGPRTIEAGTVTVEARHASLHAAISWSYALLSEDARSLLAVLTLFRAGCTAESVVAVVREEAESQCFSAGVEPKWAGDAPDQVAALLAHLCGSSFLTAEDNGETGAARFTMSETIRDFVVSSRSAAQAESLAARHAAWFSSLARSAEPHLQTADAPRWLATLDADYANLCAALDWCRDTPTAQAASLGISTATALHRYWLIRSLVREGRDRLETALAHPKRVWDDAIEARARNRAGVLAMTDGDCDSAETRYRETLELCLALGDQAGMATVLSNLAILAGENGNTAEARRLCVEALAAWRQLGGDQKNIAAVLSNLGGIDNEDGALESARGFLTESMLLSQSVGDARGAAISLRNLGIVAYKEGNWLEADRHFRETLSALLQLGDERGCAYSLLCLGFAAQAQGHRRRAHRLLVTGLAAYAAFGLALSPFARLEIERLASAGIDVTIPTIAPGSENAAAAIHAVTVLSEIIADGWEQPIGTDPAVAPVLALSPGR